MNESQAGKGRASRAKSPSQVERPRGGRARAVSEMLPDIGRAAYRKFGFVQSSVVSRWAEIVGDRYADVSTPESIRFPKGERINGVLTLAVSGAHAPMMQHVAPEIIERVNRFFGYSAVARLAFQQASGVKPRVRQPVAAPPPPVPLELGESLRTIADPELRAVLESLARGVAASQGKPVINGDKA